MYSRCLRVQSSSRLGRSQIPRLISTNTPRIGAGWQTLYPGKGGGETTATKQVKTAFSNNHQRVLVRSWQQPVSLQWERAVHSWNPIDIRRNVFGTQAPFVIAFWTRGTACLFYVKISADGAYYTCKGDSLVNRSLFALYAVGTAVSGGTRAETTCFVTCSCRGLSANGHNSSQEDLNIHKRGIARAM